MSYVLIIGAKSDIAKEVAREYAKNGYDLYLAGRNIDEMKDFDIIVREESLQVGYFKSADEAWSAYKKNK